MFRLIHCYRSKCVSCARVFVLKFKLSANDMRFVTCPGLELSPALLCWACIWSLFRCHCLSMLLLLLYCNPRLCKTGIRLTLYSVLREICSFYCCHHVYNSQLVGYGSFNIVGGFLRCLSATTS